MEQNTTRSRKILVLVLLIALPLAVGIISSAITGEYVLRNGQMIQPTLSPPAWIFPIVWTCLYVMMGLGSFFLWTANPKYEEQFRDRRVALMIYFIQLVFNFCWSIFFFVFELYWISFAWLMIMWFMLIVLVVKSAKISVKAMILFLPYLFWSTFAAYLTLMSSVLN